MSFMLTLPSDASTTTFPSNKPSSYKVKLPNQIYLPEDDWEVALSTVSFPDTETVLDKKYLGEFPMVYRYVTKHGQPQGSLLKQFFYVRDDDLTDPFTPVRTGLTFWKKIVQAIHNDFYRSLKEGQDWGDGTGRSGLPEFKWEKRGDQTDLHISNELLGNKTVENYMDINLELAKAFGLVSKLESGGWALGPSIEMKHIAPFTKLAKPSDHGVPGGVFWRVIESGTTTLPAPVGLIRNYSVLRLYSYNDWYITDINTNFERTFGSKKRTLFVYTDVAQTQIVGERMTDMIKEVVYTNEFSGRSQFEPRHLHFLPIRKNVFDVVEVAVTEADGKLAELKGGSTVLTLLFERKSQRKSI